MTQQRVKRLSEFHGRVDAGDVHQESQQLLACDRGPATTTSRRRQQCMDATVRALRQEEDEGKRGGPGAGGGHEEDRSKEDLGHASTPASPFCSEIGSRPFQSLVLSFCAMHSRKIIEEQKHKSALGMSPGISIATCSP